MKIAKDWLQQMLGRLFQPIARDQAIQIAAQALAHPADAEYLVCVETGPSQYRGLYLTTSEPCWYISAPWDDHKLVWALRSSRVILVGKLTGMIHYDGSAGEEG